MQSSWGTFCYVVLVLAVKIFFPYLYRSYCNISIKVIETNFCTNPCAIGMLANSKSQWLTLSRSKSRQNHNLVAGLSPQKLCPTKVHDPFVSPVLLKLFVSVFTGLINWRGLHLSHVWTIHLYWVGFVKSFRPGGEGGWLPHYMPWTTWTISTACLLNN